MKKIGIYILKIAGIILWFFFLILFRAMDTEYKSHTHEIILIITGILLALYIWKRMSSGTKELEKENQKLKGENQRLQQELTEQAVRRAMDKAEQRKTNTKEETKK